MEKFLQSYAMDQKQSNRLSLDVALSPLVAIQAGHETTLAKISVDMGEMQTRMEKFMGAAAADERKALVGDMKMMRLDNILIKERVAKLEEGERGIVEAITRLFEHQKNVMEKQKQ